MSSPRCGRLSAAFERSEITTNKELRCVCRCFCRQILTAEQRPLYVSFEKMVQAREYSGFEVRNPEGAYIGPWGVFLQFPELSKPLIDFINLAQKLPGLSAV